MRKRRSCPITNVIIAASALRPGGRLDGGEGPMNDEILAYYNQGAEAERLAHGAGRLELARTQELLRRYLPPAPAVVYDVGGGSGAYACWLARRGYAVHLLDAVPLHVAQARDA